MNKILVSKLNLQFVYRSRVLTLFMKEIAFCFMPIFYSCNQISYPIFILDKSRVKYKCHMVKKGAKSVHYRINIEVI